MKILVFSDSHGEIFNMKKIIRLYLDELSLLVHLGDTVDDFKNVLKEFPNIPFVSVKGNNDYFAFDSSEELLMTFQGVKCLFTHGHKYSVKQGTIKVESRARELNADIVFFGHTHIPYSECIGRIVFINPGSVAGSFPTFALVELDDGNIISYDVFSFNGVNNKIEKAGKCL